MDSLFSSTDEGVRAQVQLLKAKVQTKAYLNFQINQYKINKSYHQSNSDVRDTRDLMNMSKLLSKKLLDLQLVHENLKSSQSDALSSNQIQSLLEVIFSPDCSPSEINDILEEALKAETKTQVLREKYSQLTETLELTKMKMRSFSDILYKNHDKYELLNNLRQEIRIYRNELENITEENYALHQKKEKMLRKKKQSVDRIKIYQQLSEPALRLRSKVLIKSELKRNIKNAELELEYHSSKTEEEKKRLEELEREIRRNIKDSLLFREKLAEIKMNERKMESKLKNWLWEKDALMDSFRREKDEQSLDDNPTKA